MTTENEFAQWLESVPGVSDVDGRRDMSNSVSSAVVRCRYDGQRAVAARDAKAQIGALLDLVDLHLHGDGTYRGQAVRADEVTVLVVDDREVGEAADALATLVASLKAPFRVRVLRIDSQRVVHQIGPAPDLSCAGEDAFRYEKWLGMLETVEAGPADLVRDVVLAAGRPEVRAYPMLSSAGRWSLRVEGLEVGRIGPAGGTLGVGRDRGDRRSAKRAAWVEVAGEDSVEVTRAGASAAGELIARFAESWKAAPAKGRTEPKQDEHALESRILRGQVGVRVPGGPNLALLRSDRDGVVTWGSQFPTRWGRTTGSSARYLDALLRDGSTPWAVEIKVDGGGGTGRYYRHAVAQAVLYRAFIRQATPLAPWFERQVLRQEECEAAVVIPEFSRPGGEKEQRLRKVCDTFGIALITVPRETAHLGGPA